MLAAFLQPAVASVMPGHMYIPYITGLRLYVDFTQLTLKDDDDNIIVIQHGQVVMTPDRGEYIVLTARMYPDHDAANASGENMCDTLTNGRCGLLVFSRT